MYLIYIRCTGWCFKSVRNASSAVEQNQCTRMFVVYKQLVDKAAGLCDGDFAITPEGCR